MIKINLQRLLIVWLLLLPATIWSADGPLASYEGRSVAEVIDAFREEGHPFAYSTNLVSSDLVVRAEPTPGSPLDVVNQILRPYGLIVRTDSDVHLVVRDPGGSQSSNIGAGPPNNVAANVDTMENVVVSASQIGRASCRERV